MFLILLMTLIVNIFLFTKKSLITLMMLELTMFTLILLYSLTHTSLKNSVFFMMLLSVMMVLDSVFGICVLISNSRLNTNMMSKPIFF